MDGKNEPFCFVIFGKEVVTPELSWNSFPLDLYKGKLEEHSGREKKVYMKMKTIFDLFTYAFEIEEIIQLVMIGSAKLECV